VGGEEVYATKAMRAGHRKGWNDNALLPEVVAKGGLTGKGDFRRNKRVNIQVGKTRSNYKKALDGGYCFPDRRQTE